MRESLQVDLVVEAISASVLCCDCLARTTGLDDVAVRQSLMRLSRAVRLDTWTPCWSCGAPEETYGLIHGA